mmetsp:Transcript_37847/g.107020  ORF Transcript_37847/g.107020 Transcript_37847/m.107020 type:complete len:228 (-) Transcript_37847:131-814(-)
MHVVKNDTRARHHRLRQQGPDFHVRPRVLVPRPGPPALRHAADPVRRAREGHAEARRGRLQHLHLRVRPDRQRQELEHVRGLRRPGAPRHHAAHERGAVHPHREGAGWDEQAVLRDVLVLRDLQRDHLRPPEPGPRPEQAGWRSADQGAPSHGHLREGPHGGRRDGRREARGHAGCRPESSGRLFDHDERNELPVALRLHREGAPEGRGGRVQERLREAEPRGSRRI